MILDAETQIAEYRRRKDTAERRYLGLYEEAKGAWEQHNLCKKQVQRLRLKAREVAVADTIRLRSERHGEFLEAVSALETSQGLKIALQAPPTPPRTPVVSQRGTPRDSAVASHVSASIRGSAQASAQVSPRGTTPRTGTSSKALSLPLSAPQSKIRGEDDAIPEEAEINGIDDIEKKISGLSAAASVVS